MTTMQKGAKNRIFKFGINIINHSTGPSSSLKGSFQIEASNVLNVFIEVN